MSLSNENWIHLFQILNIGKHKDGFTLYEITSMVYPKSCPDAITKILVWKRYNDFKTLHNELRKKMKILKINDRFPRLSKASYFKRFSDRVIEDRKRSALALLEFVAKHPPLFMSDIFVKFFESSYIPVHQLKGKIDEIRDELHLPIQSDVISIESLSSGDEKSTNNSDTDSISNRSNLSFYLSQGPNTYSNESLLSPSQKFESLSMNSSDSESSLYKQSRCTLSEVNLPSIPEMFESKPMKTSMNAQCPDMPNFISLPQWGDRPEIRYMFDAAKHITYAAECEANKDYEKAFLSYKLGIGSLVNGVQSDPDLDRRQVVRHKIAKYLLQAEKIYNMYLNVEIDQTNWNGNVSQKIADSVKVERPPHELNSIKVVGIMNSVMLVQDSSSRLFAIKAIRRHVTQAKQMPVLPTNIPFMVKLYKYYNTENSTYVMLEYISKGTLWNYLKNKGSNLADKINVELVDGDSEDSYSELINKYRSNHTSSSHESEDLFPSSSSVTVTPKVIDQIDVEIDIQETMNIPEETKNLITNSQQLLNSVSEILQHSQTSCNDSNIDLTELSEIGDFVVLQNDLFNSKNNSQITECWSEDCIKEWSPPPEQQILKWASQIVIALECLHNIGVFCLNLEPKNILINHKNDIVLTYMYHWENINISRCPTYPQIMYTAPEISGIGNITKASDWWTFGVILYELLTGLTCYTCHPGGFTENTIINIPHFVSDEAASLLTQLLVYVPEDRLGFGIDGTKNVKSHKFFKSVDWYEISNS